jgi:hypothetical protein
LRVFWYVVSVAFLSGAVIAWTFGVSRADVGVALGIAGVVALLQASDDSDKLRDVLRKRY